MGREPGADPHEGHSIRGGARARVLVGAALLLLLGAGYLAVAALRPPAPPAGWPPASDLAEYTAVLHVHSRYSHDGRGTIEEIAAAAARSGARVVFLTEHNSLAPLAEGKEGWYGPTLVLVGAEITTGSGYLLLLDAAPGARVQAKGAALDELIERYRTDGSIVLLAHPDHPRLGWRGETPPVDGIEVVDVFDQMVAAPWYRQVMGLLAYPANPEMAILSAIHWPRRALKRWDRMARDRPTIGFLGLDAHGGIELTEETGVWFPSHQTAFRLGQLHFVTSEPLRRDGGDRRLVYGALRTGRFYNAFDGLAPAAGFRFEMRRGDARTLLGEAVALADGLAMEVRVPPVGETVMRVVRDGRVVSVGRASGLVRFPVRGAGVYRVEVDLRVNLFPIATTRSMPWIFSNPIYVR